MVNYENSMIYKLCCKDTDIKEVYIGSTTNFKRRKNQHKTNCNNENIRGYNIPVYKYIRANGGFNNWDMILIEKVKCNDKMELCKIEREYIEKTKNNLNKVIPTRSDREYREDNKDIIKQKRIQLKEYYSNKAKNYYEKNKDIISEKNKIKYEKNKDIVSEKNKIYREKNKDKTKILSKKYRDNNKDIIKEKRKNYYEKNKDIICEKQRIYSEKNKDIISEKRKIKMTCSCGSIVRKSDLDKHNKTIKHQNYLKEQEHILTV